jgi:hypothetical protein
MKSRTAVNASIWLNIFSFVFMSKSLLVVFWSLLLAISNYAQEAPLQKTYNGAVGIGINQFPTIGPDSNLPFPERATRYNITKYIITTDDNIIRMGLDVTVAPKTDYKYYFSGFFGGYAHSWQLLKNSEVLNGILGGDAALQQDFIYDNTTEHRITRFGLAPLAALELQFFKRWSIMTEFSYSFSIRDQQYRHNTTTFYSNPDRNVVDLSIDPYRLLSLNLLYHY